jgi:hypothetical protein
VNVSLAVVCDINISRKLSNGKQNVKSKCPTASRESISGVAPATGDILTLLPARSISLTMAYDNVWGGSHMAGQSREFPAAAIEALTKGQKIGAIKIVRQEWGVDLKDAKDAVDDYLRAQPVLESQLQEASKGARGLWIWLLVLTGVGLFLFSFLRR